MPTLSTIPLVLLMVLLWQLTGGQLLAIVAFCSVFSAASALNFGAMGVAPWLFVLAAGLMVKLLKGHPAYKVASGINRLSFCLVMMFLLYASWTSVAYPLLFQGTPVIRTVSEEPLAWGLSNFSQLCYLLAAAVLYLLALGSTRSELRDILKWYVRGCTVACLFAMYQLANAITHVPFPSEMLYSNKAHVIYGAYQINGMWRLNGTFCEASEMAGFVIVGVALVGWQIVTRPFRVSRLLNLLLMVASLLLTVSSVGYLCLGYVAVFGSILALYYVVRQGSLSIARVAFGLLLFMGGTALFTLQPAAREAATKLVSSTLLDKQNTESYRNRTETHVVALETLSKTYYMGAGWGSARASGLIYILLATVGIPGVLLFFVFIGSLAIPLFHKRSTTTPSSLETARDDQFEQSLFAVSALLLAMLVAGAEPVDPVLWILFGIATVAHDPHAKRRSHLSAASRLFFAQPIAT